MITEEALEALTNLTNSLRAVAYEHQSRLTERFRIASVLGEVAKQKQFFEDRPTWGSW